MGLNEAQKDFHDAALHAQEEKIDDNLKKEKLCYYDGLVHLAKGLEHLEDLLKSIHEKIEKQKE